jgi:phosphatidyl-myo-inositol alpha-mannosyltransferase
VPTGDAWSLARVLGELFDDDGARAALSRAGRERAAAFDWPVVAREVLQVYRAAIAADPRVVAGGAA